MGIELTQETIDSWNLGVFRGLEYHAIFAASGNPPLH